MLDISLKKRAQELSIAALPSSLHGYILAIGMERPQFTDYREWTQFSCLYKALRKSNGAPGSEVIAARLLEFIDRYQSLAEAREIQPENQKALTKKERRKLRREGLDKGGHQLAIALQKAKPSKATVLNDWKSAPRIGLGMQSTMRPPPKTRREEVKIDEHTAPRGKAAPYHALYTPGWTLSDSE